PRLRIRVRRGGARCTGAVGGAVRRLYQRRRGDHRSVPHRRPGEMGTDLTSQPAPPPRVRGPRAGAFERADRAVPGTLRRGQPAGRELHHTGAVLPFGTTPGAPRRAAPPRIVHAEEPAAAAAGPLPPRRADDRGIPAGARRPRGRGAPRGDPARVVQRQGVLRSVALPPPGAGGPRGDRQGRVIVSLPFRRNRRADHTLPEAQRDRLGAGGAAQHGAADVHAAAAAPARGPGRDRAGHRAARALQSGRGVPRGAPGRAGEARAPLPAPRGASGVGVVNGKLILVGGWGLGRKLVDSSAIYDPATNRWHNVAPIPTPRDHLTAAAVGGIVYAIGGRPFNPDHNYDLVEAYDPATNRWTKKAPMPSRRGGLASAA